MATAPPPMPPLPPQMASPMGSMIEAQMGVQSGIAANKIAAGQFVMGQIKQVIDLMMATDKVLAVEHPELLPLSQKLAQGFSILAQEIQATMPQGAGPSAPGYPNQVSQETPESAAGSVSMG